MAAAGVLTEERSERQMAGPTKPTVCMNCTEFEQTTAQWHRQSPTDTCDLVRFSLSKSLTARAFSL